MAGNIATGNKSIPRGDATNKIGKVFADYFSNWDIRLPAEALQDQQPGEIKSNGWIIQYKFGSDDKGRVFLDFYASHRMTNDRHERIYMSGEIEGLPAYQDMILYPRNATENQKNQTRRKHQQHNEEVSKELRRKGFR